MLLLRIKGIYHHEGRIIPDAGKAIEWKELSPEIPPKLPSGSNLELTITFNENDFLSGINGIVWATYNATQAEIIQNSLLAQKLNNEVEMINFGENNLFLICITNGSDVNDAIDFIWRSNSGLRLKPDWNYPVGEANKSFEPWLNGT